MKKQNKKEKEIVVEKEEKNDYVPVKEEKSEPISYVHPALQEVENARANFLKTYKKQNALKLIISIICIAALIAAFVVVPSLNIENNSLKTGIMLGIAVVALGGSFAYSVFAKRATNTKMKKYFNHYYNKIYEFVLEQEGFENVVLQEPGKISIDFFRQNNLYKDIIEVGSRGLTEFTYNKIPMQIVDCAGNIKADKRIQPVFVGKMLSCSCSYLDEHAIVIYYKGNEKALPPTNVTELKVIEDNEKYIVYSNSADVKKILKGNVKKLIDSISMNKYLIDLAISMHDGKLFICFGYDDPLMILPLQNQFDPRPNEQFKKDISEVVKLAEALSK